MADFLLELLCEEIPARMQARARNDLARMFAEELDEAFFEAETIEVWSTPRRLALIAREFPLETPGTEMKIKGPRVGAPSQAVEGFLRKNGLTEENLTEQDGILFAAVEKPGRPTGEVLGPVVERILSDFPWSKSMRWGKGEERWVRPLQGIVAMLGDDIVPVEFAGVKSGATTVGHRFHHPGKITVGGASDYIEKLRACHVIVDQDERQRIIRDGAAKAAADAGLALVEDEGLVVENAGLTEWPVPLLGRFDADYLDVPREVIVLTMRTNQKYFACTGAEGALAPAFVCVANIDANDNGAAIIEGNKRVLAARLSDARFFWEQDVKLPLEEQAKKLSEIVFHEKLGTVADKAEQVAKLARWLVEEGVVTTSSRHSRESGNPASSKGSGTPAFAGVTRQELADQAERAARLAKADLVTGMVGEFPELQGVVGGYLAERQGEPKAVSDAIRDHYKPVGQADKVPTAPVTVGVALADKLDTIFGFFSINEKPTGSKDPFALRRAGLGILGLVQQNNLRIDIKELFTEIASVFVAKNAHAKGWRASKDPEATPRQKLGEDNFQRARVIAAEVALFLRDRLIQQQRDFGIRGDLISAGFEGLGRVNDFISLLARVKALQDFVETGEGRDLLAGYKRASNILKKEEWDADSAGGGEAPTEEAGLAAALDGAEPKAAKAVETEDFTAAMSALASLRAPIDAFFDKVTVNDPDKATRARRLNLLARFRDAVHQVADFSKIEG